MREHLSGLTPHRERTAADASAAASQCVHLFIHNGALDALRFLNARTRFRFTGIYRAEPPILRNIHLFDREIPTLNVSGAVCALRDTYCSLVAERLQPFRVADAPHDERLQSHAARDQVQSYCGVPIRRASGQLWGTLCHFDVRPRLLPGSEIAVLEHVAALIGRQSD